MCIISGFFSKICTFKAKDVHILRKSFGNMHVCLTCKGFMKMFWCHLCINLLILTKICTVFMETVHIFDEKFENMQFVCMTKGES